MSAISVLLLEDEEKVRGLWVPELRRLGYVVDAASSCAEALELVRAKPFDVFVFDFLLGDGDALSVMRFARSHGCGAPTIIVSSVVTDHDVMQAGGLAHGTILRKPVLGSHIAAAIQQGPSRSRRLRKRQPHFRSPTRPRSRRTFSRVNIHSHPNREVGTICSSCPQITEKTPRRNFP